MAGPKKPTIAERAAENLCPNCAGPVDTSGLSHRRRFCDAKGVGVCKREHANRSLVEGRAIVAFAKAWRIDRGSGEIAKTSFAEVCRILDSLNEADRVEKRPRADYYAAKMLVDGRLYMDRKRP